MSLSRRTFLGATVLGAAVARAGDGADRSAPPPSPPAFGLEELSISDLQDRMTAGHETARSLVQQYLSRIDSLDRKGPTLRMIIELNPEALAIADTLDAERRAKGARGPLHGIPILLKDNLDTADRMHTSAGSLALAGHIAARDSFVAARLRAAGAILVGKTNMSEWADFRSSHASSGWSGRAGQARNPYALDRSPSGSSSGSGSAAATNCCAAAIGTETDGSITSPCAAQGLVGLKPTVGLVSRTGIIPIAASQDTAGPMARSVRDVALLLNVLAASDPSDSASKGAAAHAPEYTAGLSPKALAGVRLGVARKKFTGYSAGTDKLLEGALEVMKQLGATIVDPADLVTAGQFDDEELAVLLFEFKHQLDAYLASAEPGLPAHSVAELMRFNEQHASDEMPFFGQELLELANAQGPKTAAAYQKSLAKCWKLSRTLGIDATLQKHRLDAIVAPTQGPIWLTDLVNGDPNIVAFTSPAAVAGYPHLTVPMGQVRGLPVGLSFVGPALSEAKLLAYGSAFETATHARRVPTFAASSSGL